ncbi:MAG: hypothetical protein ACFCBW_03330 [Candidatus Competibacterales bacterium]
MTNPHTPRACLVANAMGELASRPGPLGEIVAARMATTEASTAAVKTTTSPARFMAMATAVS